MPGERLTDLVLQVFRLNGSLLAAGDDLVAELGLTSARWQVLGAVAIAGEPLPVATIARNMGLARQSVQRLVDLLESQGMLAFAPNPHHRRAKLVHLTRQGCALYEAAAARQRPWAAALARDLSEEDLAAAIAVLRRLGDRLETMQDRQENQPC